MIKNRYFKKDNVQFEEYFRNRGYKFIQKQRPTKEDWKRSPFKKPKPVKISLISVNILGIPSSFDDDEYYILDVVKNNKKEIFWVEIKSRTLSKPKLIFKKQINRS
ncbi:hypothetical protein LPB136_01695 [Tenacibaculum todarodis]|uniref:Uncharacterized protein n=1 Tax=Tenacibaculum todarodis TaxID=1850252 RepID=A0A1L3JG89_9FLAO|nr:hypothetical protein [Tenacibaculum todarodis]APG64155.1 hypothetical protein LPB136_01695 [Tenacibaculum todarodis]